MATRLVVNAITTTQPSVPLMRPKRRCGLLAKSWAVHRTVPVLELSSGQMPGTQFTHHNLKHMLPQ